MEENYNEITTDTVSYADMDIPTICRLLINSKYASIPLKKVKKDALDISTETNHAILEHFSRKIKAHGIGHAFEGLVNIATRLIELDGEDALLHDEQKKIMQTAYFIELIGAWEDAQPMPPSPLPAPMQHVPRDESELSDQATNAAEELVED